MSENAQLAAGVTDRVSVLAAYLRAAGAAVGVGAAPPLRRAMIFCSSALPSAEICALS